LPVAFDTVSSPMHKMATPAAYFCRQYKFLFCFASENILRTPSE
jgi:hypothetical protein